VNRNRRLSTEKCGNDALATVVDRFDDKLGDQPRGDEEDEGCERCEHDFVPWVSG